MDIAFKQKLHERCVQIVIGKLNALKEKLQDLSVSAANETKSSAGDKYETARAMLHIEQDQVRQQMSDLIVQKTLLTSLDPTIKPERVALGSLVFIQENYYYLSIGLGKIQVERQTVFVLSRSYAKRFKFGKWKRMNMWRI